MSTERCLYDDEQRRRRGNSTVRAATIHRCSAQVHNKYNHSEVPQGTKRVPVSVSDRFGFEKQKAIQYALAYSYVDVERKLYCTR